MTYTERCFVNELLGEVLASPLHYLHLRYVSRHYFTSKLLPDRVLDRLQRIGRAARRPNSSQPQ